MAPSRPKSAGGSRRPKSAGARRPLSAPGGRKRSPSATQQRPRSALQTNSAVLNSRPESAASSRVGFRQRPLSAVSRPASSAGSRLSWMTTMSRESQTKVESTPSQTFFGAWFLIIPSHLPCTPQDAQREAIQDELKRDYDREASSRVGRHIQEQRELFRKQTQVMRRKQTVAAQVRPSSARSRSSASTTAKSTRR